MTTGIEVVVTPLVVNVEVADPDKVGEAGATPVSASLDEDGDLDFLMSDGRHVVVDLPPLSSVNPNYIQDTQPNSNDPYVWWQTNNGQLVTLWVNIP